VKNRLKVLRAERDWSQADLAQRLEVSRQSVNAIETGKFDPSLPLAFKLARLFALPIEQIFFEEETAQALLVELAANQREQGPSGP
jgi:putative transcriptional regulator